MVEVQEEKTRQEQALFNIADYIADVSWTWHVI